MDVRSYREEFPILNKKLYLNSCSLGALSIRSREYVQQFLNLWDEYGASAWYEYWMQTVDDVRELTARVIGADKDEIALGHSVSTIMATMASCFAFAEKNEIVMTDMDFPTANYQWLAKDLRNIIIESPDRVGVGIDKFAEAITDKCALVSTSHVFFLSGQIQDIQRINDIANDKGAICIIDAYQSVGQVPVNVHAMNIDILISGGLKWLLGGPGITFMYVKKDLLDQIIPSDIGWFGVKDQFAFDPGSFTLHDTARKFETGTPSVASLFQFKGGLELILQAGLDNIHKRTKELSEILIDLLIKAQIPLRIPADVDERSAIIMIEKEDPLSLVRDLAKKGIIVDARKDCIRVSPYFYNTEDELSKFVTELKQVF